MGCAPGRGHRRNCRADCQRRFSYLGTTVARGRRRGADAWGSGPRPPALAEPAPKRVRPTRSRNRTVRTLPILLAAVLCACDSGEAPRDADRAAPPTDADSLPATAVAADCLDPGLAGVRCYVERVGPIELGGRALTIEYHRVAEPSGPEVATEAVRVFDRAGRALYEERFDVAVGDHGFQHWSEADVTAVHGEAGTALAVRASGYPSAPLSGETFEVLVPRGDVLVPLAPPITTYGTLREPPDGRLHDGDRLVYEVWATYFAVVVPVHVNLAGRPGDPGNYAPRPERHDPASGLALLDVVEPVRSPVTEPGEVTVYPTPAGGEGRRVRVRPGARVRLLEAAARPAIRLDRVLRLEAPVVRLRVRVDDEEGWVGPEDFDALGLMAAG